MTSTLTVSLTEVSDGQSGPLSQLIPASPLTVVASHPAGSRFTASTVL